MESSNYFNLQTRIMCDECMVEGVTGSNDILMCINGHGFHLSCVGESISESKIGIEEYNGIIAASDKIFNDNIYNPPYKADIPWDSMLIGRVVQMIYNGRILLPSSVCPMCNLNVVSKHDELLALRNLLGLSRAQSIKLVKKIYKTSSEIVSKYKGEINE